MGECKSKEEAMGAAENWRSALTPSADSTKIVEGKDCILVRMTGFDNPIAEFRYPKPMPILAKGTPVISTKTGRVFFSAGSIGTSGDLNVKLSPESEIDYIAVENYEPVEIVRNGRHAKAVELLERMANLRASINGQDTFALMDDAKKFLADETQNGGA